MKAGTVGLTGGIATGKSTVAGFFRARGIPVVDADQIARDVVAPGQPAFVEIVNTFGAEFLGPDGGLDREKLGAKVFGDADARATLEGITHPRIAEASSTRLREEAASGAPYVMYEAALLVENGSHRAFGALVVVSLEAEQQLARLMARSGLDEASARARIASQLPLADKIAVADFVIRNEGAIPETEAQVAEVDAALRARFAP